jgi:hypothetical protein
MSPLMESADLAKLLRVRRRAVANVIMRVIKLFFKMFLVFVCYPGVPGYARKDSIGVPSFFPF